MFATTPRMVALHQCCELCDAEQADVVCHACAQSLARIETASACPTCSQPSANAQRCGACLSHPPPYVEVTACFDYRFPLDQLIQSYKFAANIGLVNFFAGAVVQQVREGSTALTNPDAEPALPTRGTTDGASPTLVPVPLAPRRLRERGYNQSALLAAAVGEQLGVRVAHDWLQRIRETPPQSGLDGAERRRNLRGAFQCPTRLDGQRVILIDDVMTTGTTLAEAAKVLLSAGAVEVRAWVVARALHGQQG